MHRKIEYKKETLAGPTVKKEYYNCRNFLIKLGKKAMNKLRNIWMKNFEIRSQDRWKKEKRTNERKKVRKENTGK